MEDLLKSLEFLDENYETKFWYWELLEIVRKLLLTCGLTYFGSGSLSGVAIASLIANLFMLLHAQFEPIKRKSEHSLQLLSLLVISLSLMLGTLIALEQATPNDAITSDNATDRRVFSIIVLLVHGVFLTYLLGMYRLVCSYLLTILLCLCVLGRALFAAYRSVKKVRSIEGGFKLGPFLIYFFSEGSPDECQEERSESSSGTEDELSTLVQNL